jgi:hypothetical protein
MLNDWPTVLLIAALVLAMRHQGNSWPAAVAKTAGLVALALVAVTILGAGLVWLS